MKVLRSLGLLVVLSAFGGWYVLYQTNRPYAAFEGEVFVDLPRGTSTWRMARVLGDAGVIHHAWLFPAARLMCRNRTLQAGEYRFVRRASPIEVCERIARGDVFYYELVIPEGKNMFDIGEAAERLGLFSADRFLRAARNPSLIRDLDLRAPSLEGYLFPNTYRLSRHTTPEKVCQIMTAKFREVWRSLHTKADVHDTVTLASLVEKEGKLSHERPVIASVFHRRLAIGMKLDCDPTTIYATLLEGRYRGAIYQSDLASANPYNTYRHTGLPPGPIANPGLASLEAALNPSETRYLYFVLRPDGSGAHKFSSNIAEHEIASARFRRANHH